MINDDESEAEKWKKKDHLDHYRPRPTNTY